MWVSHETSSCRCSSRAGGAVSRAAALAAHGPAMRYPRAKWLPQGRGQLRDVVLISERPAEAEDRAVPGHGEGDLLLGRRPSAVATLVERASRSLTLVALPDGCKAEQVRPPWPLPLPGCPSSSGVADLGSGQGNGRAHQVHRRHRRPGVLL